jgi:valyl-tRNA synthetase
VKSIALSRYPQCEARRLDDQAERDMAILQELIVSIRNLRAELKVEPKVRTPIRVHAGKDVEALASVNRSMLERLANVEDIHFVSDSLAQAEGARTTARFEVALVYEQKVDKAAERDRAGKELARLEGQFQSAQQRLGNQQFLAKAPPHVVEGLRKQIAELEALIQKLKKRLEGLQ